MRQVARLTLLGWICTIAGANTVHAVNTYFGIQVVDEETGRGIPMVELRTVNHVRYYTDSAGWAAVDEPGLIGRTVFFEVSSPGYEYPADGFGIRGKGLIIQPGETAQLRMKRLSLAQRLYRVTGEGIYRDSVMLGQPVPLRDPLLNARVLGQDSVQSLIYRGRICWFWGDTARESYPLGNFGTAGATSPLPDAGGLDPAVGINLDYFVDEHGFSRPMARVHEQGMVWIDALIALPDPTGRERMMCHFSRMKSLGERVEHGLLVYNDEQDRFERDLAFSDDARIFPHGHPFRQHLDGQDWIYFAIPYPMIRVRAEWAAVRDLSQYQAFTCLRAGAGYDKDAPAIDRDAAGRAIWAWKTDTAWIDSTRQNELIQGKHLSAEDAWIRLRDAASGDAVQAHGGSAAWNDFRRRWVMIFTRMGGENSLLGETWYSEADAPHGPYRWARRVAVHGDYSFYNPRHHPFLDQQGGRIIYFEGTYASMFSGTKVPTPRYEYNQLMYQLDLSDPRLTLPEPTATAPAGS